MGDVDSGSGDAAAITPPPPPPTLAAGSVTLTQTEYATTDCSGAPANGSPFYSPTVLTAPHMHCLAVPGGSLFNQYCDMSGAVPYLRATWHTGVTDCSSTAPFTYADVADGATCTLRGATSSYIAHCALNAAAMAPPPLPPWQPTSGNVALTHTDYATADCSGAPVNGSPFYSPIVATAPHTGCFPIPGGHVRSAYCDMSGAVPMLQGFFHGSSDPTCTGTGMAYSNVADGTTCTVNPDMVSSSTFHCIATTITMGDVDSGSGDAAAITPPADCTGPTSPASAFFSDYPTAPGAACTLPISGSYSLLSYHCDMSGTAPRWKAFLFQSSLDCNGTSVWLDNSADGTCVSNGDGTSFSQHCASGTALDVDGNVEVAGSGITYARRSPAARRAPCQQSSRASKAAAPAKQSLNGSRPRPPPLSLSHVGLQVRDHRHCWAERLVWDCRHHAHRVFAVDRADALRGQCWVV